MSYRVEKDTETGHKYITDIKRRRSICSIDGCLSRSQRKSLCAKHSQSCNKPTNKTKIINNQNLSNKKQRWSTTSVKELSNNTNINVNEIFSHLLNNETFLSNTSSTLEIHDDTKSENSIEYDYTNPLSISTTNNNNNIQYRHVSIATIYLLDEQWHQLELFIKHFSSYASLSNNLNINSSTTHLLIDDSLTPFQCSFSKKIFQAVARHIYIVSIRWINDCLLRNEILDETPYEIHGDGTMSTMHLSRQLSNQPLFSSSISFAIDCNSFQRVLTRHDLAELVVLSGGTLFNSDDDISIKNQLKILFVLVDPTADRYRLENKYKLFHRNIKYLTPGFLLKSIIYQKQQPFEDFEL